MNNPNRFVIENGTDVAIYDSSAEFLEAMLDVLSNNESVNLESARKHDELYVTIL